MTRPFLRVRLGSTDARICGCTGERKFWRYFTRESGGTNCQRFCASASAKKYFGDSAAGDCGAPATAAPLTDVARANVSALSLFAGIFLSLASLFRSVGTGD